MCRFRFFSALSSSEAGNQKTAQILERPISQTRKLEVWINRNSGAEEVVEKLLQCLPKITKNRYRWIMKKPEKRTPISGEASEKFLLFLGIFGRFVFSKLSSKQHIDCVENGEEK